MKKLILLTIPLAIIGVGAAVYASGVTVASATPVSGQTAPQTPDSRPETTPAVAEAPVTTDQVITPAIESTPATAPVTAIAPVAAQNTVAPPTTPTITIVDMTTRYDTANADAMGRYDQYCVAHFSDGTVTEVVAGKVNNQNITIGCSKSLFGAQYDL